MRCFITVGLVIVLSAGVLVRAWEEQPEESRRLIICVDGIPWEDFRVLKEEGRFDYLSSFGRLISPFPSFTNASMVQIFQSAGVPRTPGYEDSYFSLEENRFKGGIFFRLGPDFVRKSFRRIFDYHPPGLLSGFEYVLAPVSCRGFASLDIAGGLRAFKRSTKETFLLYIGPSDCAAHTGGRGAVMAVMRELDRELSELKQQLPATELLLFSDHGNEYLRYRRVDLAESLNANGFKVGGSLKHSKDAVIPRFGLVGAAAVYVRPEEALDVADLLSTLEGVAFSSALQGECVVLFERGRTATICGDGDELRYTIGSADPLYLETSAVRSRAEWFEVTSGHPYPDSVNRVWNQSRDVVLNSAIVLVNFEAGYYEGSRALDVFVALRATHGSLNAPQSLGFIASSGPGIPEFVSSRDAWRYLGLERRAIEGVAGTPSLDTGHCTAELPANNLSAPLH